MNFKEWAKKYYPDEEPDVLHKMSHAWAAGHTNLLSHKNKMKAIKVKKLAKYLKKHPHVRIVLDALAKDT